MPVLAELPQNARIAVVRLRSLGDTLLATPALAAVKRWRPDLRLAVLVEPAWAPVLEGNPDVERIIAVPPTPAGRARALASLRRFAPQLAVNLHGGSTATWLTALSGARWRAAFAGQRHAWAHNLLAPPEPPPPGRPRWHTVEHVASLWRFLGLPPAELGPLRIFPAAAARAAVRQRLAARGLAGPFAFISAVPRSPTMQWPAERYVELLAWLTREFGLGAVFARPPAAPAGIEERIVAALPPGRGVLLDGTDVRELIALEAESSLVLGSDGGPIHVAAALAKPLVVLFGPTDALVWRPWQASAQVVQNTWPCNPCPADRCRAYPRPECILSITDTQVRAAVLQAVTLTRQDQLGDAKPAGSAL